MQPSIIISGRVFTDELLHHLRQLCEQPPRPSGNALAREVCAQLDWRSPNGRWATTSCKVALRKLYKRGLLPWPSGQPARRGPRRLRRSGQALPPLAAVPARVDQIDGLHLHLLSGADDPLSGLWNDLISAQHPCGDAPLVGAQLRYLIGSDHGWLGALGFGPAAWILGARDEWIGWSVPARKRNLPQVVSLARLLIRREVRCANLASKVLALALARLPDDWQARYGLRPLLVETFVDRDHFIGRTFLAANWRRLGTSQGRGRLGPQTPSKTPKDIYVFPLHDQARPLLQVEPPRPVTPRPLLGSLANGSWWAEELAALDLGDTRLERRAAAILAARAQRPNATFYGSFDDRHQSKRAYALIAPPDPDLTLPRLLEAHAEATLARLAAEPLVLLPQDTTSLNYSGLRQTTGLGSLNHGGSRGLYICTASWPGDPRACPWACSTLSAGPDSKCRPARSAGATPNPSTKKKAAAGWRRCARRPAPRAGSRTPRSSPSPTGAATSTNCTTGSKPARPTSTPWSAPNTIGTWKATKNFGPLWPPNPWADARALTCPARPAHAPAPPPSKCAGRR